MYAIVQMINNIADYIFTHVKVFMFRQVSSSLTLIDSVSHCLRGTRVDVLDTELYQFYCQTTQRNRSCSQMLSKSPHPFLSLLKASVFGIDSAMLYLKKRQQIYLEDEPEDFTVSSLAI